MREVYIVDFGRTAFGKMGGGLKSFCATELGGIVIDGILKRHDPALREAVDSVVAGCAFPDEKSISHARYMTQLAGLPFHVNGVTSEMACGSAIASINIAAWKVAVGASDIAFAGGAESHSRRPAKFSMSVEPYKAIAPSAIYQRTSPFDEEDMEMLDINDKLARIMGITREACDEFAFNSQQRLAAAYQKGITGGEIVPVTIPATRKSPEIIINKDEHPRRGTTMESLAKLRTINADGVTTAGNASGVNDGAAFLLMMTKEKAEQFGLKPLAKWIWGSDLGAQPSRLDLAAGGAIVKALKQKGLRVSDIDVFECNEAFAAQNLGAIMEIEKQTGEKIDRAKWNPNGGAIAIGHPNGASGARIAGFAINQLKQTDGKYGVFATCCGGGNGVACIIENV